MLSQEEKRLLNGIKNGGKGTVKIKLIRLLLVVMVSLLGISCGTFSKREINVIKLPDPVFLLMGEEAPYDGWLVDEEMLSAVIKEAYR